MMSTDIRVAKTIDANIVFFDFHINWRRHHRNIRCALVAQSVCQQTHAWESVRFFMFGNVSTVVVLRFKRVERCYGVRWTDVGRIAILQMTNNRQPTASVLCKQKTVTILPVHAVTKDKPFIASCLVRRARIHMFCLRKMMLTEMVFFRIWRRKSVHFKRNSLAVSFEFLMIFSWRQTVFAIAYHRQILCGHVNNGITLMRYNIWNRFARGGGITFTSNAFIILWEQINEMIMNRLP